MSTSQFFGLNIGYTGLQAANAALNVTGNNISNVETKGYTRQEAIQAAADALRTNTSYGMAGAGVDTKSIDQIRNAYYDLKYWQNNASKGIYDIKQQYYRQIEDYFTDTDDVQGFNVVYSDMFDALDEVYKSAGDDTKKAAFLSRCKALTEYFNNMHTSLQRLQTDANNEIMNKVNEINSIASELATLNKQINTIEVNHVRANELRDKRNLLIDQLSEIVDVKVPYTQPKADRKNPEYTDISWILQADRILLTAMSILRLSAWQETATRRSISRMQTVFMTYILQVFLLTFTAEASAGSSKALLRCVTVTMTRISPQRGKM